MQYAHNLSFKESKTFIIFIIISADSQNLREGLTVTQHISMTADFIWGLTLSEFWNK